jgi:PIN domain nuclease of toxin-antitoxin system
MKLLLDTHAFVWWDDGRLPSAVARRIQRAEDVLVSAVTAWEIAIKSALGKMTAKASVAEAMADHGFRELPITVAHADAVRALPAHHRDPFDRMLVAQAMVEDLVIVSTDPQVKRYRAVVVWD